MTFTNASIRIKCSPAAWHHARDFMDYLTVGDGRTLLGSSPGARRIEKVGGHKLIANRLKCGGIEIKETRPQVRELPAECDEPEEVAA